MAMAGEDIALQLWKEQRKNLAYVLVPLLHYPQMLAEYEQHRGLMEFGAEAAAHLSMNELGQLTDEMAMHSRGYRQGWLKGERPPDKAIREVFSVTDRILKAGRLAVNEVVNGEGSE